MPPTFDPILSKLRNKDNTQQITSILNDIDALKLYNKRFQPLIANITEFDANDLTIKAFESQDLDNLALKGLDETNFLEKIENLNNQYGEDLLNEYKTIRPIVLLYNGVRNYINDDTKHAIDCWYGLLFQTGFDQTIIAQARDRYYLYEWEKIGDGEIHTKNEEYADNGTRQIIAYRNLTLGKEAQQWTITEITNNQNNQIEPYDDTKLKTALQQQLSEINSAIDKLQQQLSEINLETIKNEIIALLENYNKNNGITQVLQAVNDFANNVEQVLAGEECIAIIDDNNQLTLQPDNTTASELVYNAYLYNTELNLRLSVANIDTPFAKIPAKMANGIINLAVVNSNFQAYLIYQTITGDNVITGEQMKFIRCIVISTEQAEQITEILEQHKQLTQNEQDDNTQTDDSETQSDTDNTQETADNDSGNDSEPNYAYYDTVISAIDTALDGLTLPNHFIQYSNLIGLLNSETTDEQPTDEELQLAYQEGYTQGWEGEGFSSPYDPDTQKSLYDQFSYGYDNGYRERSEIPSETDPEENTNPEPNDEPTAEQLEEAYQMGYQNGLSESNENPYSSETESQLYQRYEDGYNEGLLELNRENENTDPEPDPEPTDENNPEDNPEE